MSKLASRTAAVVGDIVDTVIFWFDTASSAASFRATWLVIRTKLETYFPTRAEVTAEIALAVAGLEVADPLGDADFAGGEGFMRKTGAGTYEVIKSNLNAAVDPTVNDDSGDGYAVGSQWLNTTLDKAFICLDSTVGAAVWKDLSTQGNDSDAIHDNVSGEIAAIPEKTATLSVAGGEDLVLIEDSESSNAKKRVKRRNLTGSYTYNINVADDTAVSFAFGTDVFSGHALVASNGAGTHRGLFAIRAAAVSAYCISLASSGITPTTGVLAGTTGSDGAVTLSTHTDNTLYLENRSGATVLFTITVFRPQLS